jgi:hypothetical protein
MTNRTQAEFDTQSGIRDVGPKRVALRLLSQNPGSRKSVGAVSENSIMRQQARRVRWTITSRRNPADLAGACSGGKFVVSSAGEAYDAQAKGLNRKFRLTSKLQSFLSAPLHSLLRVVLFVFFLPSASTTTARS